MAKAALIKLLLLVILAVLICLPEFFKIYSVSKVNFLCHPYQPCLQKIQVNDENRSADDKRRDVCDPFPAPDRERWKQISTQMSQSNLKDSEPETQEVRDEPEMSWFVCETDKNMDELHNNITASGLKTYLEVSVEVQLKDSEILNLTFYGRSNNSSLHLHLPEEDQTGDAEDEWWCVFRVIWLALLCVVLLIVFIAVIEQVYRGECLRKKPKTSPITFHLNGQQFHDGKKQTDVMTSKAGTTHQSYSLQLWSRLPTIQEVDSQSDAETLLDGNACCSYMENLHHRDHPSASVSTEE